MREDQIVIGNHDYYLVEVADQANECRRRCAFRHRCFNAEYAAELEVRISTGEVVKTRARPCEVLGKLAKGRWARKYIFALKK